MIIMIRGIAKVRDIKGNRITGQSLKDFDGLKCQDNFMEYFQLWETPELEEQMLDALLDIAYMHFEYNDATGQLETVTTYSSNRKLSDAEEKALIDYTQGQWSDGIGEGFEQHIVDDEFYISPWFNGQVATLTYEKSLYELM